MGKWAPDGRRSIQDAVKIADIKNVDNWTVQFTMIFTGLTAAEIWRLFDQEEGTLFCMTNIYHFPRMPDVTPEKCCHRKAQKNLRSLLSTTL